MKREELQRRFIYNEVHLLCAKIQKEHTNDLVRGGRNRKECKSWCSVFVAVAVAIVLAVVVSKINTLPFSTTYAAFQAQARTSWQASLTHALGASHSGF